MKPANLAPAIIFCIVLFFAACAGKNNKPENGSIPSKENNETTAKPSDDGVVPAIDIAGLKDEASILDAMEKVVSARIADEQKKAADATYKDHYIQLMRLHTAVLRASTEYTKSITDPNKALEFSKKVNDIEKKLDKH